MIEKMRGPHSCILHLLVCAFEKVGQWRTIAEPARAYCGHNIHLERDAGRYEDGAYDSFEDDCYWCWTAVRCKN